MIVVNIIPTGLGAPIGGHAGDGLPAAKLLASVCDTLITHPNVLNASDINEMTDNMLYVEGSALDRFLEGKINLQPVKSNKVLVAVNAPVKNETINAVSAARATIGLDAFIVELNTPLVMIADKTPEGNATGHVTGVPELVYQLAAYEYNALAVATPIDCKKEVALDYFQNGGVNPWGGVEAIASRLISDAINKPVAHAPVEDGTIKIKELDFVCDPRIAAEMVSMCYLHCVLKGLHKAPSLGKGKINVRDVDVLVSPDGICGRPHRACREMGIPIIFVGDNTVSFADVPADRIKATTYFEAAGMIKGMEIGVTFESIIRPLPNTIVYRRKK